MCDRGMLKRLEELAIRKAGVFGRTLTDTRLAEEMKSLAKWHEERANVLAALDGETVENIGGKKGEA